MALVGTHKRNQRHAVSEAGTRNRHWPLLLIAAPAAVAIWSGWVGLGGMSGFGVIHPLPGIWDSARLNTAITLPVGVEAYGAFALYTWLSGTGSQRTRDFARNSALGALVLGALGQVAFHLLVAFNRSRAPWLVVVAVACLPVVTLAFAASLVHLLRADAEATPEATSEAGTEVAEVPVPEPVPEPASVPEPEPVPASVPVPAVALEDLSAEPPEAPEEPASVPPEIPAQVPRSRPVRLLETQDAKRARADYRKSVNQGQPLSQRALADKHGRSKTWAAARIREVEEGPALTAQAR